MNDFESPKTELNIKTLNYNINKEDDFKKIIKLGKALANLGCMKVFKTISSKSLNMSEISKLTNLPISSVSKHIDTLNDAELIHVYYQPGLKGHMKIANKKTVNVSIDFNDKNDKPKNQVISFETGVGMFTDCKVNVPCGMANKNGSFALDSPGLFFIPDKFSAELLWFSSGYVTYKFPTGIKHNEKIKRIRCSLELCSETMYYREKFPSDITFYINDIELFTWTSPGDFGGRQGKYTPKSWPPTSTQFGLLKTFIIDSNGVTLDNLQINSKVKIDNLNIEGDNIELKIEVKENAIHKGGINIFGKNFGDYNQSIIITIYK